MIVFQLGRAFAWGHVYVSAKSKVVCDAPIRTFDSAAISAGAEGTICIDAHHDVEIVRYSSVMKANKPPRADADPRLLWRQALVRALKERIIRSPVTAGDQKGHGCERDQFFTHGGRMLPPVCGRLGAWSSARQFAPY